MAEILGDWAVASAWDLGLFGKEAQELDIDDPVAERVLLGFISEDDDHLVTIQLQDGLYADRRILVGKAELLAALRMAEIIT